MRLPDTRVYAAYDPMGWNKVLCPALTEAIAEYSASATAKNFTNTYLPLYDTCPMLVRHRCHG